MDGSAWAVDSAKASKGKEKRRAAQRLLWERSWRPHSNGLGHQVASLATLGSASPRKPKSLEPRSDSSTERPILSSALNLWVQRL